MSQPPDRLTTPAPADAIGSHHLLPEPPDVGEQLGPDDQLEALVGQTVVLDVRAPYLYIGTLTGVGQRVVSLRDADVHFCGDSQTTAELYILESKKNEVRPNRATVHVVLAEVVSISRLADVIEY
jgi:hypothetical protein